MRYIVIIYALLMCGATMAQVPNVWKGTGIAYTHDAPNYVPGLREAWVHTDTTSGRWWVWDHKCTPMTIACWREMVGFLQPTNAHGAPTHTPGWAQSQFAINSGDSLYFYQSGSWALLNDVPDLTGYVTTQELIDTAVAIRADFPVAGVDTVTILSQDSILIYSVNGGEVGRDTIRSGLGDLPDLSNYVQYADSTVVFVTPNQLSDSLSAFSGGGGSGTINGAGSVGYLARFLSADSIHNSGLFWDETNNRLGIGTQSPAERVDIRSALLPNTGRFVNLQDSTTGSSVKIGLYYLSGFDRYPGIWLNQSSPNTSNYAFLFDPSNNRTLFNAPIGGSIRFRIGNLERAELSSSGNFTVGNTGGFARLTVAGSGTTFATASFYTLNASGQLNIYSTDDLTTHFGGKIVLGHPTGPQWSRGVGSPEGVVTAPPGSIYSNTNGGAGTTFYVKESGTGNTGWVAK